MKVGTFFSGVGSPEQALNNLGIPHEIEFACDIDKYAKETYLKNFNPKNFYTDITTLKMQDLASVDLLVFGFPCQAFSMAGKRKGFDDTRGTLFYDALRYLIEHRPRYFIAENVRGLLSHDNGKTFQTIIDCLAKTTNYQMSLMPFDNLGYHIHYKVLNTKDYGIPQNRERIFIVGIRDDKDNTFTFPREVFLNLKLKDLLEVKVDNKYFLSEKMIKGIQNSNFRERQPMDITKLSKCLKIGGDVPCFDVKGLQRLDDLKYKISEIKIPSATKCGYEVAKEGDSIRLSHLNSKTGRGRVGTEQSQALCTGGDMHTLIGSKIRRLTPIECERLQGFPDNFTEGVSDTQRYKQMGNTITVNVIQAILKTLIK